MMTTFSPFPTFSTFKKNDITTNICMIKFGIELGIRTHGSEKADHDRIISTFYVHQVFDCVTWFHWSEMALFFCHNTSLESQFKSGECFRQMYRFQQLVFIIIVMTSLYLWTMLHIYVVSSLLPLCCTLALEINPQCIQFAYSADVAAAVLLLF